MRTARIGMGLAGAIAVAGGLALAALAAVPLGPAQAQGTTAVTIENFAFAPASITVPVGSTVTWTNQDAAPHTATADDGSFDTGTLNQGQSGSVTLSQEGTFAYHCEIHPDMTATLTVTAAGGGAAEPTQPPTGGTPPSSGGQAPATGGQQPTSGAPQSLPSTGTGPADSGDGPISALALGAAGLALVLVGGGATLLSRRMR